MEYVVHKGKKYEVKDNKLSLRYVGEKRKYGDDEVNVGPYLEDISEIEGLQELTNLQELNLSKNTKYYPDIYLKIILF